MMHHADKKYYLQQWEEFKEANKKKLHDEYGDITT
jgi:hypothetical protein